MYQTPFPFADVLDQQASMQLAPCRLHSISFRFKEKRGSMMVESGTRYSGSGGEQRRAWENLDDVCNPSSHSGRNTEMGLPPSVKAKFN